MAHLRIIKIKETEVTRCFSNLGPELEYNFHFIRIVRIIHFTKQH